MTVRYYACNGCGELIAIDNEKVQAAAREDRDKALIAKGRHVVWHGAVKHKHHLHRFAFLLMPDGDSDGFIDQDVFEKAQRIYQFEGPFEPFGPDYSMLAWQM